jgi:hypothetical protein
MRKSMAFLLAFIFILPGAYAGQDEENFDASLVKTQELLRNKNQREKAFSESENGKKAAEQLNKLSADPKTQDEYYDLAADIMGNFKDKKDEEAMKKTIQDAQKDPASFYNKLTPAQKEKIKALSEKLSPGIPANP